MSRSGMLRASQDELPKNSPYRLENTQWPFSLRQVGKNIGEGVRSAIKDASLQSYANRMRAKNKYRHARATRQVKKMQNLCPEKQDSLDDNVEGHLISIMEKFQNNKHVSSDEIYAALLRVLLKSHWYAQTVLLGGGGLGYLDVGLELPHLAAIKRCAKYILMYENNIEGAKFVLNNSSKRWYTDDDIQRACSVFVKSGRPEDALELLEIAQENDQLSLPGHVRQWAMHMSASSESDESVDSQSDGGEAASP